MLHPVRLNQSKGILKIGLMEKYLKKLVRSREKLFKAFKKMRLHINKELYKKTKYDAQKLITAKTQAFFDEKLSESLGKPKELWNTMKSLGIPKKTVVSNFNAIDDNKSLTYDIKTMSKVFKDFFSNLAKSFLDKLPDPSNNYNLESMFLYYSTFAIPQVLHIKGTSKEKVFKIMGNIKISKAAGVDTLPGRFLKDGTVILSKPISEICNHSIFHEIFSNACKVAKLKPIFKKGKNFEHLITVPSRYCH